MIGIFLLFAFSLIPILYVSQYDFATGDDYAFGAYAHLAFQNSHSIIAAIKASAQHTADIYYTWQGTWLSCFLFGLHPEVFNDRAYVVVPWIMLFIMSSSLWHFCNHFFIKNLCIEKNTGIILTIFILSSMIQLLPSKPFGIFWFNGALHYTVPYSLMLLSLVSASKYLKSAHKKDLIILSFLMLALGGMSYPAALAAPVGICLILLFRRISHRRYAQKKDCTLLVPLILELIGLVISALAPGNKVRGGEKFGFSFSTVIYTIGQSFVQCVTHTLRYLKEEHFIIAILFASVLLFIFLYKKPEETPREKHFKNPLLFILFVFLWDTCVYAPEIYAGVSVSEGVDNTYFFSFVISIFSIVIYTMGWLMESTKILSKEKYYINSFTKATAFLLICITVFVCRHPLKYSTAYICYDFVTSGNAQDFKNELLLQQKLLSGDEKTLVLPSTNGRNGPIINMSVTPDSNSWNSRVIARFYGKDSVTGLAADDWHKIYD